MTLTKHKVIILKKDYTLNFSDGFNDFNAQRGKIIQKLKTDLSVKTFFSFVSH